MERRRSAKRGTQLAKLEQDVVLRTIFRDVLEVVVLNPRITRLLQVISRTAQVHTVLRRRLDHAVVHTSTSAADHDRILPSDVKEEPSKLHELCAHLHVDIRASAGVWVALSVHEAEVAQHTPRPVHI